MIRKIIQYITHDIWVKKEHEYKSRKPLHAGSLSNPSS